MVSLIKKWRPKMSETNRKVFTGTQKAKVAIEAVKNQKTMNEIAQEFGVHPTQIGVWKKILVENSSQLFDEKRGKKSGHVENIDLEQLYAKIGKLNMELEWLKKSQE
jgi:transposase